MLKKKFFSFINLRKIYKKQIKKFYTIRELYSLKLNNKFTFKLGGNCIITDINPYYFSLKNNIGLFSIRLRKRNKNKRNKVQRKRNWRKTPNYKWYQLEWPSYFVIKNNTLPLLKKSVPIKKIYEYWRNEYKLPCLHKSTNNCFDLTLLLSRFVKGSLYFLNQKNRVFRFYKWQIKNERLSSFQTFTFFQNLYLKDNLTWNVPSLNWISFYAFFGSYFLDQFKSRYIYIINKCVVTLQLKLARYNAYLMISDGFCKKLYSYYTIKQVLQWEKKRSRLRMNRLRVFCRLSIKRFVQKLKKNKKLRFRYCRLLLKKKHFRTRVILQVIKRFKMFKILAINFANKKTHNGLRLPKRRRK